MSNSILTRWAGSVALSGLTALAAVMTAPARADIPDLTVAKQVNSASETIQAGEMIQYATGLTFTGIEDKAFSVVEIIPEPLQVRGTVELMVQAGQVSNRRVTVETRRGRDGGHETVVRWRGTMTAGATGIQLLVPVRAEVACLPGQSEAQRRSRAVIAMLDGSELSTTVSRDYVVQCPPMASIDDIAVTLRLQFPDEEADAEPDGLQVGDNHDGEDDGDHDRYAKQVIVHATLVNHNQLPAAIGVAMDLRQAASEPPGADTRFVPIMLSAGESRTLEVWMNLREYVELQRGEANATVTALEAEIRYLMLSPLRAQRESVRSGPADEIHTVSQPFRLRAWDLGDAPASDNRDEVSMEAYPGVQARFPTVFDAPRGAAQSPAHVWPDRLRLGRSFSLEADADLGREANIQPPANRADQDEFDDGTHPHSWNLQHCRSTTIEVQVFVSREASAWFAAEQQPAFLNAWLDFDRDGQWTRVLTCPTGRALEHIVIDHPVDVATLGPGYHTLQVPTGRVHWPEELAQQPAWARLVLSEEPSVKTAAAGSVDFGDGRGPGYPWQFGETEDYLLKPPGAPGAGPDLQVRLSGSSRAIAESDSSRFTDPTIEWIWIMEYANIGSEAANQVALRFQFPEFLTREQIEAGATFSLVRPRRDAQNLYQRLDPEQYLINNENFTDMTFGKLDPGEQGRLMVHFIADLDDEVIIDRGTPDEPVDWTVHAAAITAGDINPDNRTASFSEVSGLSRLNDWPRESRIAARSPTSPFWVPRGTTNQSSLSLRGMLPTGETALFVTPEGDYYEAPIAEQGYINIWLQVIASSSQGSSSDRMPEHLAPGVYVEEVSFQPDGRWELELADLTDAHYRIAVGDPRACDHTTTGLGGDEAAWIVNSRPFDHERRDFPAGNGRPGVALSSCALFTVDSSLPIDPLSLGFSEVRDLTFNDHPAIDGKIILPDTLGFSRGEWSVRLPASTDEIAYVAVFAVDPSLINPQPRLIDRYADQQREIMAAETHIPGLYQTEPFLFDQADALFGLRHKAGPSTAADETPAVRDLIIELSLGDMDLAFAGRPDVARRGRVWKAPAGAEVQGVPKPSEIAVDLLVGLPFKGHLLFVPWNGEPYGQPGSQIIQAGEADALEFQVSVPRGIYQLVTRADGYHTHRSLPFIADGPIERDIILQPHPRRAPARVIMIEDQGMSPAWTDIPPGATVRLVNVGTGTLVLGIDSFQHQHGFTISRGEDQPDQPPPWQSGQLLPGDFIDLVVGEQEGLLTLIDQTDPNRSVELLIVQPGDQIFRDRFTH